MRKILDLLHPLVVQVYQKIFYPTEPNLLGDRDLEYAFISANLPSKKGKALDFGSSSSPVGLILAEKGYETISLDLRSHKFIYHHKHHTFLKGDILEVNFKDGEFDLIVNCSTIEHVGIPGRYGIKKHQKNADLLAMQKLSKILKDGGIMLMTIPIGQDTVFQPKLRVYGEMRLPKLIKNFKILKCEYWTKNSKNQWEKTTEKRALRLKPSHNFCNIGCFVLGKK